MPIDPHEWATQIGSALKSSDESSRGQLSKSMQELAEACGLHLKQPNFGLHSAIKLAFSTKSIPKPITLALSHNPNNAKQAFHAAKIKVLKSVGGPTDYLVTRLNNSFKHIANELKEIDQLEIAIVKIINELCDKHKISKLLA